MVNTALELQLNAPDAGNSTLFVPTTIADSAVWELYFRFDFDPSNGNRLRLWKVELQRLADETGLEVCVCHFPPGTSKWNKIEHRLFSFISRNWRARPLVSLETIVSLIAATTTRAGLKVYARLDPGDYPAKVKVSDAELKAVNLHGDEFHPEWNYTIKPRHTER